METNKREKTDWRDALLAEGSLWEVFRKSGGLLQTGFNAYVTLINVVGIGWLVYAALINEKVPSEAFLITIRFWSSNGSMIIVTILAFLIAGFSVFATVTRPDLFHALAKVESDRSPDISELKEMFFNFMNVFVHFTSFLGFLIILSFLTVEDGVFHAHFIEPNLDSYSVRCFLSAVVWATAVWFTVAILKLKSFVWNIYTSLRLAIVFSALDDD